MAVRCQIFSLAYKIYPFLPSELIKSSNAAFINHSSYFHHQCIRNFHVSLLCQKSRKKTGRGGSQDSDSDSDSDGEGDSITGKGTEVKTSIVSSMRVDLILKVGLGVARNKVEEAFYESKLRVNSRKITKKSFHVRVGDEVDLIKGTSPNNPAFLTVGRIEILSAKPREESEGIMVKMRKTKSLVIENYPDGDPWKHTEAQST